MFHPEMLAQRPFEGFVERTAVGKQATVPDLAQAAEELL
jgi:hypothetical protein